MHAHKQLKHYMYGVVIFLYKSIGIGIVSGGFKSQQCQQLLTGPPKILFWVPSPPKRNEKSCKQRGQKAPVAEQGGGRSPPFFGGVFTFWNHWNLFLFEISTGKTPLKGPTLNCWQGLFFKSVTGYSWYVQERLCGFCNSINM